MVEAADKSLAAHAGQSFRRSVLSRALLWVSIISLLSFLGYFLEDTDILLASLHDETARVEQLWINRTGDYLEAWLGWGMILGLSLGAGAVSKDRRLDGEEPVARDVEPSPVALLGRWMGLQAVVVVFFGVGVAVCLYLLHRHGFDPGPLLWVGVGQWVMATVLLTTLALVFGVRWRPFVAALVAALVFLLPWLALPYLDHSAWLVRWLAATFYYGGPALPQGRLLSDAISHPELHRSLQLPVSIALENGFYSQAVLGLGLLVSWRRRG